MARFWRTEMIGCEAEYREAVVSRDERNEYHGIGGERAQRILDALGAQLVTTVESLSPPPTGDEKRRQLVSS
jgi:hypothetical protein